MNPEQVPFPFFDETLNKQIKINLAAKLLSFQKISDDGDHDDENIQEERIVNGKISFKETHSFLNKEVDYFITPQTLNFFKSFNISTHFLHSEPDVWKEELDFLK